MTGKIVGNSNTNLLICDNIVEAGGAVVQLGYTKGLTVRSQPGEDVLITDNQITATETAISLNGVKNVRIHGNLFQAPRNLLSKRTEE